MIFLERKKRVNYPLGLSVEEEQVDRVFLLSSYVPAEFSPIVPCHWILARDLGMLGFVLYLEGRAKGTQDVMSLSLQALG